MRAAVISIFLVTGITAQALPQPPEPGFVGCETTCVRLSFGGEWAAKTRRPQPPIIEEPLLPMDEYQWAETINQCGPFNKKKHNKKDGEPESELRCIPVVDPTGRIEVCDADTFGQTTEGICVEFDLPLAPVK